MGYFITIQKSEFITLKVYDIMGKEITTLLHEKKLPGKYKIKFVGRIADSPLPSGVYIYRLKAGKYIAVKKMLMIK